MDQTRSVSGAPRTRRTDSAVFARIAPAAAFLSQLIAERDRLPPQRQRRRAPLGIAVAAYSAGARMAVRRLPAGYREARDV